MLVTISTNTTHRSICNKGSSMVIAKYQVRRRRGRISAAVQSICLSSSRGCIGNSTRPISDGIGRMAQPPVRRCMSRNNVRVLAFGGLHVTLCCTYWGWPDYSYSYRSVVRPELFSICCLSASVDEIFTWCATAPGCMGVSLCGDTHASREYC